MKNGDNMPLSLSLKLHGKSAAYHCEQSIQISATYKSSAADENYLQIKF